MLHRVGADQAQSGKPAPRGHPLDSTGRESTRPSGACVTGNPSGGPAAEPHAPSPGKSASDGLVAEATCPHLPVLVAGDALPSGPAGESIHVFQGRRCQTSPVKEYSSRADGPPPGGPESTRTGLPGHRLPGFASPMRGGRPKPLRIQDFSAQAIMSRRRRSRTSSCSGAPVAPAHPAKRRASITRPAPARYPGPKSHILDVSGGVPGGSADAGVFGGCTA